MGKPKLKSTIRALHNAIFGFRPPGSKTTTWVCIQQAKTKSFREAYKSFNSMYYSSTTSSDLCSLNEDCYYSSSDPQGSCETHTLSASSTSSSASTATADSHPLELALKGFISSQRFFFSPCTTKSIMDEAQASDTTLQLPAETGTSLSCSSAAAADELGFCKESVTMAMTSHNPYMDFRLSMEEMVQAHGLKDWSCLQQLLHCYLSLNDHRTHKLIVLAFADLLINLLNDHEHFLNNNNSSSNSNGNNKNPKTTSIISFPLPLCLDV